MENPIKKSDLDAIVADVEKLKKELAKTMGHLQTATANGAANLTDYVGDEAGALYKSMTKKGERATKAINRHVEEQPVQSLLIAFGVGFLFSRLMERR